MFVKSGFTIQFVINIITFFFIVLLKHVTISSMAYLLSGGGGDVVGETPNDVFTKTILEIYYVYSFTNVYRSFVFSEENH